uniref:Guided entry of tail-anchored proteins factor 4 n=1 Tax=Equus caballus TaxID=9796 RepID=A0A9L0TQE0_HORSE
MAAAAAMAEQESARNGARNRGGVQRVEGKLRASVEKGDYYEAHQMYRTLFFRYTSQSKHAEARELMCSGALLFFSHGQQNSAADLSMLVLESLEKAEVEVADELLENLAKLFSLMDPNSPERVAFVSRALKWSSGGSGKLGHPRLHQLLALTLWKEQNYCESRYHFLHSTDGEGCANMLVEYSTSRGFRSEVDMFVAQAVLQFLCLKNKSSASVVFTTYTQKHPSIEGGPPFVQPLLNFIWFLLLAVDGEPSEQPHGLLGAGGRGQSGRQQPHRAGLTPPSGPAWRRPDRESWTRVPTPSGSEAVVAACGRFSVRWPRATWLCRGLRGVPAGLHRVPTDRPTIKLRPGRASTLSPSSVSRVLWEGPALTGLVQACPSLPQTACGSRAPQTAGGGRRRANCPWMSCSGLSPGVLEHAGAAAPGQIPGAWALRRDPASGSASHEGRGRTGCLPGRGIYFHC